MKILGAFLREGIWVIEAEDWLSARVRYSRPGNTGPWLKESSTGYTRVIRRGSSLDHDMHLAVSKEQLWLEKEAIRKRNRETRLKDEHRVAEKSAEKAGILVRLPSLAQQASTGRGHHGSPGEVIQFPTPRIRRP